MRSASEFADTVCGYFTQDSLLVRKWLPHAEIVGVPVCQIVVTSKFRSVVLKVAHDESGHSGVRKT